MGSSTGKESACNAGDRGSMPGWGSSLGEGIGYRIQYSWASLVTQTVKNPPAVWEVSSATQSRLTLCNPLQHARPPCPSPTPGVHPNLCPLSRLCHPTISSSVVPFSSHLQSFLASGSLQMSQFFSSGAKVLDF